MDRMFAAPFISQLGAGHQDGVYCLAKDVETTDRLASASADGMVKIWDLSTREETQRAKAHEVGAARPSLFLFFRCLWDVAVR